MEETLYQEELEAPKPSQSKYKTLITAGLNMLSWMSPLLGLGFFFPIGVLMLYPRNVSVRSSAFQSILLQFFILLILYPLDLFSLYDVTYEMRIADYLQDSAKPLVAFWALFGLVIIFIEARYILRKYGTLNFELWLKTKKKEEKPDFVNSLSRVFGVWLLAMFWFFIMSFLFTLLFSRQYRVEPDIMLLFRGEGALFIWLSTLLFSIKRGMHAKREYLFIFRRAFLSLYIHQKLAAVPITDFNSPSYFKKFRFARMREYILPGWGHIYLRRYWKGFPVLFIFLLIVLFFAVSLFYFIDFTFGIRFLTSLGLKSGIPDQEFLQYVSKPYPAFIFFILGCLIYLFSTFMIDGALKKENEPLEERGLQSGFFNNFYISLLAHLIIFSIIFIIPITVMRSSSSKRQDTSRSHFQPEKMEFYFVDPEIPDEVKDLNGGVVSGTETTSKEEGEKIPDEPEKDGEKVKGYVKKIKGKKLPRTYSNYISARMRGPENFLEYWKRAPHPYSSVVAYTITPEGDIIDVVLVEGSSYPDQDELTLELIKSMSPLMPPPGVKGDVRVTELFWNGSIDPEAMPTPLQKEMVLHFDGRYMEEVEE